ncbi:hypothetical protein F4677DRAFT_462490 [Hypoxylon crocopeplum]|nr:hypothetical protein F4677DRAFT_462490 [Hypoxylon crocopeplum]
MDAADDSPRAVEVDVKDVDTSLVDMTTPTTVSAEEIAISPNDSTNTPTVAYVEKEDSTLNEDIEAPATPDVQEYSAIHDEATTTLPTVKVEEVDVSIDEGIATVTIMSHRLAPIKEVDSSDNDPDSPKSAASETINSVVSFHIDTDLAIPVKTDSGRVMFKVASANIASASPVWRTMLYGDGGKGRSNMDDWVVHIDGDHDALSVIFQIVHYNFSKVPTSVTLGELYDISCVLSQYRCIHLVHPWAAKWLKNISAHAGDADAYSICHKGIFIAWTLGDVKLFRDMSDALIISCKLNARGQLVNVDGKSLNQMVLPHGLANAIASTRTVTLSKILEALDVPFKQLASNNEEPRVTFCKLSSQQKECESMMLGSIVATMMAAGLFPAPEAAKFLDSIRDLKAKVDNIKPIEYVGRDWKPHLSHKGCSFKFSEAVVKCLKEMPVPLGDKHLQHLSAQAKIAGIDNSPQLGEYLS